MEHIVRAVFVRNENYKGGTGGFYQLTLSCGHHKIMKSSQLLRKATWKVHCLQCKAYYGRPREG
jgi:hypothetical protein